MTIKNDAVELMRLYSNYFRAHRNLGNYMNNHPNNSLIYGVGLQRRNAIGTAEQALRRGAANIMRRHDIRSNTMNGRRLTGRAVTVYIPQLLRRLKFKHMMQKKGIPENVINAYIRHVN